MILSVVAAVVLSVSLGVLRKESSEENRESLETSERVAQPSTGAGGSSDACENTAQVSNDTMTCGERVCVDLIGGKWWLEDKIAESVVTVKNIEWEDIDNDNWDKTIL